MSAPRKSQATAVKVLHEGVTRRFTLPETASVEWIRDQIAGLFGADASKGTLTWRDDEDDWVGLCDAEDLAIAIDVSTQLGKPIRLRVTDASDDLGTPDSIKVRSPISRVSTPATRGSDEKRNDVPVHHSQVDVNEWELVNEGNSGSLAPHASSVEVHNMRASPAQPATDAAPTTSTTTSSNRIPAPQSDLPTSTADEASANETGDDIGAEEKLFANIHEAFANLRDTGVLDLTSVLGSATDGIDIERLVQAAVPHLGTTFPVPPPHVIASFAPFFTVGGQYGGAHCRPQHQRTGSPPRCCRPRHAPDAPSQPTTAPTTSSTTGTPTTPPTAPGTFLPVAPLSFGSRGEGVKQLQHYLVKHGILEPTAIRRFAGFYGPQTARAIWAFQQAKGLDRDDVPAVITPGTFDNATRSALLALHMHTYDNDTVGAAGAGPQATGARPHANTREDTGPNENAVPPAGSHETMSAEAADASPARAVERWEAELATLASMGFVNVELLTQMLDDAGGSVLAVVSKLIA